MEELKPRPANSSPLTPLGFLERAATVYGDRPSIAYGDTTYTWSQTHRRCLQVASAISSLGIKRGPRGLRSGPQRSRRVRAPLRRTHGRRYSQHHQRPS